MSAPRSRQDRTDSRSGIPLKGIRPVNVPKVEEILDRVHFGSVVVDRDGITTFLSQPYAEFLGVDPKEVVGRHVTEVIENTRMHVVVKTGEVEIGKQCIRGEELIVQRVPIRSEDGEIIGAFGQVMFKVQEFHDLVRRLKLLESKVAYYEQELRSIRGSRYTFEHIIGESPKMREAKRLALRADLYYRLDVVPIRIPPLRERREDIPALAGHILRRLTEEMGRPPVRVAPAAIRALQDHHWPGNVREMVNVLERVLNALDGDLIEVAHLPFVVSGRGEPGRPPGDAGRLRRLLKDRERQAVHQALEMTQGNKARADDSRSRHRAVHSQLNRERHLSAGSSAIPTSRNRCRHVASSSTCQTRRVAVSTRQIARSVPAAGQAQSQEHEQAGADQWPRLRAHR